MVLYYVLHSLIVGFCSNFEILSFFLTLLISVMDLILTRSKINKNALFTSYFLFCSDFAVVLLSFIRVLIVELPLGMASLLIIKHINKAMCCCLIIAISILVPRAIQFRRICIHRNVTPNFPSQVTKNKNGDVEDLSVDTVVTDELC